VNNIPNELKEFMEFAQDKFMNHKEELEICYQCRRIASNDLRHAYLSHQQILEMELLDKIDELLTIENVFLKPMLYSIKDKYIEKLKQESIE
jgi:hypothetical protein